LPEQDVILGAGVSGLAAAGASGLRTYEADAAPGGICRSQYIRPGTSETFPSRPEDGCAYRFEVGGGHWIFGGDPAITAFLRSHTPMQVHRRRSAVYFPDSGRLVPFPLQYHLSHLEPDLAARAFDEIRHSRLRVCETLSDWIEQNFGSTLTKLFFGPFHEAYTAGLWTSVAPADAFKSPLDLRLVERGMEGSDAETGYNHTLAYPSSGMDALLAAMSRNADLRLNHRAARIDCARREIQFEDGGGTSYRHLLSTIPLDRMVQLTGMTVDAVPGPATSVLTLNIGARRGPNCPDVHWIYLPRSRSGFFRVGFYSNVDPGFLPAHSPDRVAVYVERAYRSGQRPAPEAIEIYARSAVEELRSWGMIGKLDVLSPSWVETAYTWSLPGSRWRELAMGRLLENGVCMTGRYGLWRFQGIAESVRDGLSAGAALRP
jgi:protoporphyrinogen oxidase